MIRFSLFLLTVIAATSALTGPTFAESSVKHRVVYQCSEPGPDAYTHLLFSVAQLKEKHGDGIDVVVTCLGPGIHLFAKRPRRAVPADALEKMIYLDLAGVEFHSLYGHLALASLDGLREGKAIRAGEVIASIGARPLNGNWPPHLHFQLIRDMQGNRGDYPGVVRPAELDYYRENCPDPRPLLVNG